MADLDGAQVDHARDAFLQSLTVFERQSPAHRGDVRREPADLTDGRFPTQRR
ncbi:hypothetical protein [Streptomyces europaeiscabiei]|uniref:hypothetical protein n=1 Tax=Streptomyces europaeiscabiei TaxID=146819 RepID=UPI0029B587BA|nr:hypothetical protein [Streptomyces europaeiscabiei]MDX2757276.1 hypothetical protein [Streptomyces europaeiscabiei]